MLGGITLEGQDFFIGSKPDHFFTTVKFDGILGLGLPALKISGTDSVLENLVNKKLLTQRIFSIWLSSREGDGDEVQNAGQITFGGVDKKRFRGEHVYVPVLSSTGFWNISVSQFTVRGKDIKVCVPQCFAFVDSGTTDIVGPRVGELSFNANIKFSLYRILVLLKLCLSVLLTCRIKSRRSTRNLI